MFKHSVFAEALWKCRDFCTLYSRTNKQNNLRLNKFSVSVGQVTVKFAWIILLVNSYRSVFMFRISVFI